jgi:RNA polymerase sigma factor (sigma-70 family)
VNHRSDLAARLGLIRETTGDQRPEPALPLRLSTLLQATGEAARDDAWADFVEQYSRLLLRTIRRSTATHDAAMDRYAWVLEQLRRDNCRRLRRFAAEGRGKFTTWFVVVVRRLCVDYQRHVHGRVQTEHTAGTFAQVRDTARKNLATLMAHEFDLEQVADRRSVAPDVVTWQKERHEALVRAVGSLDDADQLLLTLRFEDDVPMARIARLIGVESRFQVHRRLNRILSELRESLRKDGITNA